MRVLLTLAALVAVSQPVTAEAQSDRETYGGDQQIGTRFLREPETEDAARARWMQKRIANCAFNRHRDEAVALLANSNFYQINFDALEYTADEFWEEFEINYCMGRLMRGADNRTMSLYMQIPYATLRNLMAEEAYLRSNDQAPVITASSEVDLSGRFGGTRVHPQISTMAGMADCIVYNAPQESHDLLEARPGSGSEEEIIDALGPIVAACAGSDETLTVSSSLVRQMVADGLWSRSYYTGGTAQ